MKNAILAATLALLSVGAAHAGTFNCMQTPRSTSPCASMIDDLVTNQFTERFSSDRFEIVVVGQSMRYDDGTVSGFATVGVAPIGKPMIPMSIARRGYKSDRPTSPGELAAAQRDAVRYAVAKSMKQLGYQTLPSMAILGIRPTRVETVTQAQPVQKSCRQVKRGMGYDDGTGHEAWGLFEECD